MGVKTKLKINKANYLSGWKNKFINNAGKDLESSVFKMLNEVVRHVAMPNEWEYMKLNQYIKEKTIKKLNNQRGIFITNILSKFLERIIHTRNKII